VDESASLLFSFDRTAGPTARLKNLGQLCAPGMEDRRDIPYPTLALALGRDRKLYYAVPQKEFDLRRKWRGPGVSHLLTYDLNTGEKRRFG